MHEVATPFPLPDAALLEIPPDRLAEIALSTVRGVYGIALDFTLDSLARLDAVLSAQFCRGTYTAEQFPVNLALVVGVYFGELLRRQFAGGRWGEPIENLYRTPLPFLLYSRDGYEYERQINVVEDILALLWAGRGAFAVEYFYGQHRHLQRLGFIAREAPAHPTGVR